MARGPVHRFTDAEKARMLRLSAKGKSNTEIGRLIAVDGINISGDRVRDFLRRPGIAGDAAAKRVMPPPPVAPEGGFIKPPTLAQLMGKR